MEAIADAIAQTPWWVYLVFIFLIYRGVYAKRTRITRLRRLFIIPVIFALFSIYSFLNTPSTSALIPIVWCISTVVGLYCGWLLIQKKNFRVDKEKNLIEVPGTWFYLVIILVVFISKYYFNYELAMDTILESRIGIELSDIIISAVGAGLVVGRLACYIYRMREMESVDLSR